MRKRDVAPDVLAFLAAHLSSLEQFQLLLHLMQAEDRWWDSQTVARELAIPAGDAHAALDHLAKHNLLDIRITGDVRYRFSPGTAELEAGARACAEEFRRVPVEVLAAVTRGGPTSVRDFADAFRIRRDDDR
jgi:DNA-binding IclR family transcriptional regulator